MLSNCLNNFIGLRGFCSDADPESGLYVNDLPSVSLKMLSNIAEEEQKNYSGLWSEIYSRTLSELESDVLVKLQKYFKTNIIIDNSNTGYYVDPYVTSLSTDEKKGVTIEVATNQSRFLTVYVNSVQLYLPSAVNGDVFIYNLMNGELLDTISFTGSTGINTIQVNKKYTTDGQDTKLFICYNSNLIGNSIDTTSIDGSTMSITRGAKINNASSVIKDNLTYEGSSYGLIASYNVKCDISTFICTSKDSFKFALWWKLGSSIMFERMTSSRLNKYTLNKSKEELKELWEYYEEKYDGIMKSILDNLQSSSDGICFSCRKKRNYKYLNN